MKIKIVHILNDLDFGGVETMALNLIRGFHLDADQTVIALSDDNNARIAEFKDFAKYVYVFPKRLKRSNLAFCSEMAEQFDKLKPDLVLSYCFGNHAWIGIAARIAGIKNHWVRVESDPSPNLNIAFKSFVLGNLGRFFCRGEIAVSGYVKSKLLRLIPLRYSRVKTIPNCVDDKFWNSTNISRYSECCIRVVMIARFDDSKDHETLLMAALHLKKKIKKIEVDLVGDGLLLGCVRDRANQLGLNEIIFFHGRKNNVEEYLVKANVAVLATKKEGFGLSLVEAIATGTPIVATDIPVVKEVLRYGSFGYLYKSKDYIGLAKAILEANSERLTNPERFVAIKNEAQELYSASVNNELHRKVFKLI